MTRAARPLVLAALSVLVAACTATPAPASAPASAPDDPEPSAAEGDGGGLSGQIAYVAGLDPQIHLLDLATGESRQLTQLLPEHAELADAGPLRPVLTCGFGPTGLTWSPDGERLAFAYGACESVLYVVDLEGELTRIADGRAPTWSPDGRQLVFAPNTPFCMGGPECGAEPAPGAWSLQVVDLPGGAPRPLTLDPAARMAFQPRFSPDGHAIAFSVAARNPNPESGPFNETFVVPADGGKPRLIARGVWPSGWLLDGRLLLIEELSSDLVALDLDSGDTTSLGGDAGWAPMAPDGSRLLLNETDPQTGNSTVRLMTLDGDILAEGDGYPAGWAPDSRAAVIVVSGSSQMIILDRDGAELGSFALPQEGHGLEAAWRPEP
jgi:dipeptidyl aminopeptidase/acylaminoacyl peptidase